MRVLRDPHDQVVALWNLFLLVLALDVRVSGPRLHRGWAVQRHSSDDVPHFRGLHVHASVFGCLALQLKDPRSFSFGDHREGLSVTERNPVKSVEDAPTQVVKAPMHDAEVLQPQHIHLDQTQLLDLVLVVLRHERLAAGNLHQRHQFGELITRSGQDKSRSVRPIRTDRAHVTEGLELLTILRRDVSPL